MFKLQNNNLFIALSLLFIVIITTYCMYCYRKNKKESFTTDGGSTKTLFFFKASWCGHCKRFQPVWDEFKSELESNPLPIQLKEFDVDEEETKPLLEQHNVRGFPTILLEESGKEDIVFTQNRTVEDLMGFCKEHL